MFPSEFKFLVNLVNTAVFVLLLKLFIALASLFTPLAIVAIPLVFTPESDAETFPNLLTSKSSDAFALLTLADISISKLSTVGIFAPTFT